jgi:ABC-type lipoprotein release transport system permease subunit
MRINIKEFFMATLTSTLSRQHSLRLLPAIAKLAGWRFKQMWRFLLVTWLGMLAMVVLACAPPLFSRIAISTDLRSVAANSPDGQNINVQVISLSPTLSQVQQIGQQLDRLLKQSSLGAYLQGTPQLIVQTPPLNRLAVGDKSSAGLVLDGYDPAQTAQHAAVIQGRLPQTTTGETVEIALTQDLARNLGLHVGSVIQEQTPSVLGSQTWMLHVVGIIAPRSAHDPFWLPPANPFGLSYTTQSGSTVQNVLAASETIRAKIAALQTSPGKDTPRLFWSYPFNSSHLDANDIPALSQATSDLDLQVQDTLTQIPGVAFASPAGFIFETLSNYAQQIVTLEIMISFLLFLILAIILFLVAMMSDMLVERQAAIIATLRSRGATQQHVFGTFVMQGLVIGSLALLAGPLLAILLVRAIAQLLLSPANQLSLNVITANPIQSALDVKWYAVIALVVGLFVMIVAIYRSSKLDIVTLRRESSRTKHVPFWRRLNLDLLVVLLIVVGYVVYNYIWQTLETARAFDPLLYNMLKTGSFIVPSLLVAALLMLFLRFFPLISRLASRGAAKKRGAPAVLAFAQMERAPRPAARIIVLLALTIAASCFLLTLMMTKQVRTSDAAAFAVGADFSGPLPASDAFKTFDALKTQYSTLPGVLSATLGYSNTLDDPAGGDLSFMAIDAATYAHTALWSTQNSSQPLLDLTGQLVAHRPDAAAHDVVYALVDAALWQQFGLSQGESFTLAMNDAGTLHIHFIALAQINSFPGNYDTPIDPQTGGGLVVDYQSFATVYAKDSGTALSPNSVWLHTQDDVTSLARIRASLPDLQDRRLLITANQENSVHIDIIGVLAIGVGAALILALIGTLLSSWLNASNRLTSFAVMRALGMAPRQVAAILLWEQGFVYLLAFLLGTGLGAALTTFAAPAVSLLDLTGPGSLYNPYDVPPVQTVIPYLQLSLLLAGLVIICLVALLLMARIVARPSIGQTLRLNED